MKVSSLEVAPGFISILPDLKIATILRMRIIKVVVGIINFKEWTPLTEFIVCGIVCVISYIERRILEVIQRISIIPWLSIFEVIKHEDCMYK